MDYYRKTAAVFLLIITLILPIFLEKEELTGVVDFNRVYEESRYIDELLEEKDASAAQMSAEERKEFEEEVFALIENAAEETAAENSRKNYTAVIFKTPLYRGGEDITDRIIDNIDKKYDQEEK